MNVTHVVTGALVVVIVSTVIIDRHPGYHVPESAYSYVTSAPMMSFSSGSISK
jgi:hypothetical protein